MVKINNFNRKFVNALLYTHIRYILTYCAGQIVCGAAYLIYN